MAHARASIRSAVETALTGLTTTGSNVFTDFDQPAGQSALPALAISIEADAVSYDNAATMGGEFGADNLNRAIELHVQGYAQTDAELDSIAEEVEAAMHTAGNFSALPKIDIKTGDQTINQYDYEGDAVIGLIDMVFIIEYRTAEGAPSTFT